MGESVNRLDELGRTIAGAQEALLQEHDRRTEARKKLLTGAEPRTVQRKIAQVSWCIGAAGLMALMMLPLVPYHYRFGFMKAQVEVAMDVMRIVLLVMVLIASASLVLERSPAGGLRVTRSFTLMREFAFFVRERKIWWMTPIMLVLTLLGTFIVLTEKSVVLPFIYAVF